MRKLMILTLVMLSSLTFAQNKDTVGLNIPQVNGMVIYKQNFNTPGKSAAALFANATAWFDKRYNGLDSVNTQDAANGRLVARGWEKLAFKGPLGLEVANRAGIKMEITAAIGSYSVKLSNIIMGYMEDPTQPRIYFTAEDLMDRVLGVKFKGESGFNPAPFNKNVQKSFREPE
ncbi:DUF4468 domain-containing protein [Mucilaginibacter antarcticus]|uniref:DUF4468 domain-containing protein n=1 Tax=Mucilaginibacter antarcticus TaxID=1855725 RepID=UPI003641B21B